MDYALKNTLVWLYVSVASVLGIGVLWIVAVSTFWMFPEIVDPPTVAAIAGLALRIGVVSIVSAAWTFVSILGWRRLIKDVERWTEEN